MLYGTDTRTHKNIKFVFMLTVPVNMYYLGYKWQNYYLVDKDMHKNGPINC